MPAASATRRVSYLEPYCHSINLNSERLPQPGLQQREKVTGSLLHLLHPGGGPVNMAVYSQQTYLSLTAYYTMRERQGKLFLS